MKLTRVTGIAALIFLAAGLGMNLFYAPPFFTTRDDGTKEYLGEAFRIFFFHVPAAWVSFLCFLTAFIADIAYLVKRRTVWDSIQASAVEVGWVFSCIVIFSGPIWARAAWGTYWTWEPRLTTFLVLWLMYIAGILLRGSIDDFEKRGRFTAAYAILAFVNVPVVVLSIRLWGAKSHPSPGPGFFGNPAIRYTLFFNLLAFTIAAFHFFLKRYRLEQRS